MAEPVSLGTLLTYLTLISVPVGVFYHILTLRNQSRNRQATLLMQMQSQWTGGIRRYWGEISRWGWNGYDDFMEKYGDLESQDKLGSVGGYFEGIGVYVREGLLPIRLVALFMTTVVIRFHEMFGPIAEETRVRYNCPRVGIETEYLYHKLKKYIEEHPDPET